MLTVWCEVCGTFHEAPLHHGPVEHPHIHHLIGDAPKPKKTMVVFNLDTMALVELEALPTPKLELIEPDLVRTAVGVRYRDEVSLSCEDCNEDMPLEAQGVCVCGCERFCCAVTPRSVVDYVARMMWQRMSAEERAAWRAEHGSSVSGKGEEG